MTLQCGTCSASVQNWMRYCPKCGAAQVHLQWVDLSSPDGIAVERLNVDPSEVQGKKVRLYNAGQTRVHLRLDDHRPPSVNWINFHNLKEELVDSFVLDSGEFLDFDLRFDSLALREAFSKLDTDASLEINTSVDFLCTDIDYSLGDRKWSFRTLNLPVFLAKRPFISPNLNLFRFLSWERLEEGFEYHVDLGNFSPEERKIKSVTFADLEDPTGAALTVALPPEVLEDISTVPLESILEDMKTKYHFAPISSHTKKDIVIKFQSQGEMETGVRRFYGAVTFELDNGEELEMMVGGLLGHEPKIELKKYNPLHQNTYEPVTFKLYNSGDLPLELNGVSLFKSNNESARFDRIENTTEDWLLFKQSDLYCTLQPKETKEIQAQIVLEHYDPKFESNGEEKPGPYGFRQVIFHHSNEARFETVAAVQVPVEIGEWGGYVGIDFGTSNSMVCVGHRIGDSDECELEVLNIADGGNTTQLRSLLWYTSHQPEYYVGSLALAEAGQQWANLVRSMKTIVNQNSSERFSFIHKSLDDSHEHQKITYRTAQELMNYFINNLSRSSEKYLSGLVSSEKERLNLEGSNIRLQKAIFTHPVDIDERAFAALMAASHAAGVNKHLKNLEEFREECCVDESTAAALYLIYTLVYYPDIIGYDIKMEEKILCVDIGGGTTDLTPIEYSMDELGIIAIHLESSKGVERLGGDQLDVWLAEKILEKVIQAENDVSVDSGGKERDMLKDEIDNLWMALNSFSYQAFTNSFQAKVSRMLASSNEYYKQVGLDPKFMLDVFKKSSELLKACEHAKMILSDRSNPSVEISTTTFWPDSNTLEKLDITQKDFLPIVQRFESKTSPLMDATLAESLWSYDDLSIVMFTGQTTYSEQLRELILSQIVSKRTKGSEGLFVVHPDPEIFCPKSCVSKGAALYPVLKGWFVPPPPPPPPTECPIDLYVVPKHLQRRLKPVVYKDTPFPVEIVLELRRPKKEFDFYAGSATSPMFEVKLSEPVQKIALRLTSLDDVEILDLEPSIKVEIKAT